MEISPAIPCKLPFSVRLRLDRGFTFIRGQIEASQNYTINYLLFYDEMLVWAGFEWLGKLWFRRLG